MPISDYFISKYVSNLENNYSVSDNDIGRIRFFLQSISWELEKILYIAFIFFCLGEGMCFLFTLSVLITIRIFSGGYHQKTNLSCLLHTFLLSLICIFLLPMIPLSDLTITIVSIGSLLINFCIAPLCDVRREAYSSRTPMQHKIISTVITLFWLIIILRNIHHHFFIPAFWVIALQNIQLIIEFYTRRKHNA